MEKYIYLPKERYHIPMYLNERKFEVGDVERYTVTEKNDEVPYKVDMKTLTKLQTRKGFEKIVTFSLISEI
jgi:hypothetical protein